MKKLVWLIIAVVILAGLWWYAGRDKVSPADDGVVKVGGLFGLTGYVAGPAGEASRDGFLLAIEDSGMAIDYVIEDFHSDIKTAVTAAQKLIEVDHVDVVIGPEWAEFGEAVAPIANEKQVVFVSPWMVSESDWLASPHYFSMTPSERSRFQKTLEYMVEGGMKNVVFVYSNNAWSLAGVSMLKDELQKNGQIELVSEFKFNQDETDYRTDILKIKSLDPDAIYSLLATDESHGIFAQQLKDLGLEYPMFLDNSRAESPVLRERFLPVVVGSIYPAPQESSRHQEFVTKYEQRFGHKPASISAATAYDATTLVLDAIKSGASTSDDIRVYLENVTAYNGYSNVITFNDLGQVASEESEIRQITPEGFKVLSP